MSKLSTTDKFTMAHNVLNLVDMLLSEAGFKQDSSVRQNLKIAKSIFRDAETEGEQQLVRTRTSYDELVARYDQGIERAKGAGHIVEDEKTVR